MEGLRSTRSRYHFGVILGYLALSLPCAWSQQPVVFSGGVVNAASYLQVPNAFGEGLSGGSIASVFGQNLAASTQTATTVPLPTSLGGTTVAVYGIAAPLFYVSPGQINFQVPSGSARGAAELVVTTAAGSSDSYDLGPDFFSGGAIFTMDASGCGRGAVLNVAPDGGLSLNSSTNSVSPGQVLAAFGTGAPYIPGQPGQAPDGYPAPVNRLIRAEIGPGQRFEFGDITVVSGGTWAGRAPGLIGVDQYNAVVPAGVREGCAVPFQMTTDTITQPVTIAIRNGGGPCVDPPEAGYGEIVWEKTISTSLDNQVTQTETVTASLQASPGKQTPPAPAFDQVPTLVYFGPSCPIPGYRSLDAGTVTVQGSGFGPVAATLVPLQGQVRGLHQYQAALPAGAIQPGAFTLAAKGGTDTGAFQSTIQIGADIQINTNLAGVLACKLTTLTWTGGDPKAWVTVSLLIHSASADEYLSSRAHVSDGSILLPDLSPGGYPCVATAGLPFEWVVQVEPDPSQIGSFSAPGLSLGGRHTWRYVHRFATYPSD